MIFPASSACADSSSWNNTNLLQQPASFDHITASTAAAAGEGNLLQHGSAMAAVSHPLGGGSGIGGNGGAPVQPAKPLSMPQRARLAGLPQPQPGLNCPRCNSTNTKFCYFNNYSLTQPRYFCRACRRYWTRGGALRSVPVGSGVRRYAYRFKPKAAPLSTAAATAASASATLTPPSIACTGTLQAVLSSGGVSPILPPLPEYRVTDSDMANLAGFSFLGAGGRSDAQGMEQLRMRVQSQMHRFPFLHALDQQMGPAMAMPSMFDPGLQSGGGGGGGGGGVDSGDGGGLCDAHEERSGWHSEGHEWICDFLYR